TKPSPHQQAAMKISVIIPAFNEAGNIGRLVTETYTVVPSGVLAEVVVVDDCSDDTTSSEVKALIGSHPGLRYLRHGSRCGQSAAMRTGIAAAASGVVATLDGDGQNDPADLVRLLAKLAPPGTRGPALVGGVRASRKAESKKRWASKIGNWARRRVLNDDCPDSGCGIKVYWRDAFLRLPFFTSFHRYLPALFLIYGHEVCYVPVNDRPRLAGKSKYNNIGRALIGIYDLIGIVWLRRRTKIPTVVEDKNS
ncbi:MAG: glycosyltransferase family 2 protein, partial [Hyphomicrobiaceae bacterium]